MTDQGAAAILARLDPELVHAYARQPDVGHPDPFVARKFFVRAFKLSRGLRGEGYLTDQVEVVDTSFRVPEDGREIAVRGYHPRHTTGPVPVLVFFHGAVLAGDLDTEHARCLRYAHEVGCAVISVAYRRPPEDPFPAPTEDCYAALEWVQRSAAEWGGDPGRIAIGGSSSGAMLAAGVAIMARDRGGPKIALQVLLYPALDDRCDAPSVREFSVSSSGKIVDTRWVWEYYLGPDPAAASSPYAVPARCTDFTDLAPAYVLVAEIDPLRDEALDYATGMMRAGVRVELHLVSRTCHGFEAVAPDAAVSRRSLREQVDALRWAFENIPG